MAKPKRIFLVRHGESEGNADYEKYASIPDYKLNLTENGEIQAYAAGERMRNYILSCSEDASELGVYLSPYYRTRQTCEKVLEGWKGSHDSWGKLPLFQYEDPRLREQEYGHLRPADETKVARDEREAYGKFYYRLPDGESGADVYDRMSTFIETLHRDFEKEIYPDNVLIVTHGLTLRLFLMRWFHLSVEEFESMDSPKNCEFRVMEYQDYYKRYVLLERD